MTFGGVDASTMAVILGEALITYYKLMMQPQDRKSIAEGVQLFKNPPTRFPQGAHLNVGSQFSISEAGSAWSKLRRLAGWTCWVGVDLKNQTEQTNAYVDL
ncbi:hypothetical protein PanWU01x14_286570 [Parasponia andersonii]|uniref:Uncharacterized protein n=1 Tax=Parasponia andersonii TaxID=3476 RepID=A0A2P5AZ94_PARAD|nr:hypothetical protein PanWU01x14_286570 [Parasponia andersonii]